MALRARLERLGKLHYLQFWVTDRCCEGGNPLEHWITKIFPGITRAPLKDRFHLVKAVLQTLNEGFPQLKSDIGQELIAALIEFPEAEMAPVVRHLRSKGKARSDTQARSIAKKTHRKNLRFKAHPAQLQHQRWRACRLRWTAHAEEKWNAKERCPLPRQGCRAPRAACPARRGSAPRPRVPLTPANRTGPGSEGLQDTEADLEPCSLRPPTPAAPPPARAAGLQGRHGRHGE